MDSEEDDCFSYDSDDYDNNAEQIIESLQEVQVSDKETKHYKILREEEIKKLLERDISDVSSVLSVSRSVACTLLCQNRWNLRSVYDRWFSNDENRDAEIKLAEQQQQQHIHPPIKEGPGCLALITCPEPGCKSLPGLDMVGPATSPDDKDEYYRSYVDSSTNIKWCPNLSCDLAIEFDNSGEGESDDVTCDCGYTLCWSCGKEGHSPLDCEMVAKWIQKNKSEADSTAWILANTKPCPKCGRAIQNVGFDHVTCGEPCGYEFCWRCRGPWELHGPGGPCYRALSNNKATDKGRGQLEKYVHYYERWESNDESRKRALVDLYTARQEHVDKAQLRFVVDAWEQIVECRRVLKWSYAYGYYLWESGSGKLGFFEHLQREAECAVERFQDCAEMEMGRYLSVDYPSKDFDEFRSKLLDITWVTRKYFDNLVRALENNLSEVKIVDSTYVETFDNEINHEG